MMEGTGIQYPDCHPLYRAASIGLPPPMLRYGSGNVANPAVTFTQESAVIPVR
jgi:hypothetical protein